MLVGVCGCDVAELFGGVDGVGDVLQLDAEPAVGFVAEEPLMGGELSPRR